MDRKVKIIAVGLVASTLALSAGCNLYSDHHDTLPFYDTSEEVASREESSQISKENIESEPEPLNLTGITVIDKLKSREQMSQTTAKITVSENTMFSKEELERTLDKGLIEGSYLRNISDDKPKSLSSYLEDNEEDNFKISFTRQTKDLNISVAKELQGTAEDQLTIISDISVDAFINYVSRAAWKRDKEFSDAHKHELTFADLNTDHFVTKGIIDCVFWGSEEDIKEGYRQIFDGITFETYEPSTLTVKYKGESIGDNIKISDLRRTLKKHCRNIYKDKDAANMVMNYMVSSSLDVIEKVGYYTVMLQGSKINNTICFYNLVDPVQKLGDQTAVLMTELEGFQKTLLINAQDTLDYQTIETSKRFIEETEESSKESNPLNSLIGGLMGKTESSQEEKEAEGSAENLDASAGEKEVEKEKSRDKKSTSTSPNAVTDKATVDNSKAKSNDNENEDVKVSYILPDEIKAQKIITEVIWL